LESKRFVESCFKCIPTQKDLINPLQFGDHQRFRNDLVSLKNKAIDLGKESKDGAKGIVGNL
jgi:hypothetical protein